VHFSLKIRHLLATILMIFLRVLPEIFLWPPLLGGGASGPRFIELPEPPVPTPLRGAFDSKGGRRPQSPVPTTVNGDCSASYLRQRPAYESGRQGSKRWSTLQHLDDGWSRLKTEVYYEVVNIRLLAKLSLVTFSEAEPATWLYYCLSDWSFVCY